MRQAILALCVALTLAQTTKAQLGAVDPYARDPQSTLSSWPVLYKLPPGHGLKYYQMGWCGMVGRGARYEKWYRENTTFNVNAFPEASLEGKVTKTTDSVLVAEDANGQAHSIVVYPDLAVTDVRVTGVATPKDLKRELWVRFVGRIVNKTQVEEPVTQLEIYSPRASDNFPRVAANGEQQTIAGRLIREANGVWQLKPARAGQISLVSFSLSKDAQLTFDVNNLSLVQPGHKLEVRGRLFDVAAQTEAAKPKEGFFSDKAPKELSPEEIEALKQQLTPVLYACELRVRVSDPTGKPEPPMKGYSYSGQDQPAASP